MQWYERVLPCAENMSSSRALGRIFKILEARVSFMSLSDGAARLNVPDRALVARTDVATSTAQSWTYFGSARISSRSYFGDAGRARHSA